ncbi:MAG: 4Fe-4S binding protein [Clostridia bacterium]|nr:4Fe-4S binding protein [Clostridia bacterium]
MAKVTFNEAICKACGLCVEACPKKLLVIDKSRVNAKGYNVATIPEDKQSECVGCASCAVMCPDCVITVTR